jgi:hypothetical protein
MKGLASLVWITTTLSRLLMTDEIQIVEKHSALLETNHGEPIPVDADHSAIYKFETNDDYTFKKVYGMVKRTRNNSVRIMNEQSSTSLQGV